MTLSHAEQYQKSWQERQEYAENMLPIIGRLYRNKGIEVVIYGRPLVSATTIDIIKAIKPYNVLKVKSCVCGKAFRY